MFCSLICWRRARSAAARAGPSGTFIFESTAASNLSSPFTSLTEPAGHCRHLRGRVGRVVIDIPGGRFGMKGNRLVLDRNDGRALRIDVFNGERIDDRDRLLLSLLEPLDILLDGLVERHIDPVRVSLFQVQPKVQFLLSWRGAGQACEHQQNGKSLRGAHRCGSLG